MTKDPPIIQEIPEVLGDLCQELGTRPKMFFMSQCVFMYVCTVIPWYPQGWFQDPSKDAKMGGCESPLYKMV